MDVNGNVVLEQFLLEEGLHEGEIIREEDPSEEVWQGDGDETEDDEGGDQEGEEAGRQ